MPRKAKPSGKESIPRVKKQKKENDAVLEHFVKRESKPVKSVNDEKRFLREQKRAEKRERQRRNDVSTSAEMHLEKATDSFQTVTVSGVHDVVMTDKYE